MSLVVDASVALAWCVGDPSSAHADFVLTLLGNTDAIVPPHWEIEVLNGLMVAEKHGRVGPGDPDRLMGLLAGLPITVASPARGPGLKLLRRLADQHRLSTYDAAYLELALRNGDQLISMDPAIANAARKEGVGGS